MLIFVQQCPRCSRELTGSLIPMGHTCQHCRIVYKAVDGGALYEIGKVYPEVDMVEKMPKLQDDGGKLFKYLSQLNQPEVEWGAEELEP